MKRTFALAAVILLASSVSACGLTGPLQRPGPLIGNPSDAPEAELPDGQASDLPQLPSRPSNQPSEAEEDELLGGPGGS
ncbi:lipoprotein [Hyphomonas sp. WL0036]|uniref:LPS translocon maturation chaperone LptM n=1 Tax=Hyphomonas sediminis TaxID=2866160 RepID=UPI001C7E446F|nr:lipoprotein [Hyphomonas sediminis]MBY9065823.1 lipoprotein [Hyphomonas sediminis]